MPRRKSDRGIVKVKPWQDVSSERTITCKNTVIFLSSAPCKLNWPSPLFFLPDSHVCIATLRAVVPQVGCYAFSVFINLQCGKAQNSQKMQVFCNENSYVGVWIGKKWSLYKNSTERQQFRRYLPNRPQSINIKFSTIIDGVGITWVFIGIFCILSRP